MKATKFFLFRVTVAGNGTFPIDMLRYDRCCPASETDAQKISNTFLRPLDREKQRIVLVRHSVNNIGPTVGRWASFGWAVVDSLPVE